MVLLQIPIYGYNANARIATSIAVPFFGNHHVKFLGYAINFSVQPNLLLRIDSNNLFTNSITGKLYITSDPADTVLFSSGLEFDSNLNGIIDIDIVSMTQPPGSLTVPTDFTYLILYFDLEPLPN